MRQKIFRILADLRFAIFILLLISLSSILGTIIEQDQPIETYKLNYPLTNPIFSILSWDVIIKFQLDHVYKSWWFVSLTVSLGISLIFCSFLQQLPSLKIARRCQFFRTSNPFYLLKNFRLLTNFSLNKILSRIKHNQYSIFHQKNMIYCYKGLIGRIAPIAVHLSMILILIGTIIGSLMGFKAQEIISKTDSFHIQNIVSNSFLTIIPKTSTRINDFWITYTKTKTISQFYSNISILDSQGNEKIRKTISVNFPLIQNNIYYYQTDWNLVGLRIQNLNNIVTEYPLINIFENSNKIGLTWISNPDQLFNGIIAIIDNLEGYFSAYNKNGEFLGNFELNEHRTFSQANNFISLSEIISSTGLQIKTDPGILIVYFGFFLLMISTLISYVSYSQVWIIKKNKELFIGGTTNRALFEFELEFLKFIK